MMAGFARTYRSELIRCGDTMVDYLTDILLTEDKDVRLDGSNDLATVSEERNLRQGIALSTMDITSDIIGSRVTVEELGLLEERVREYLEDDPHVGAVQNVTTETYNRQSNRVTMRVALTEGEFELPLDVGA